MILARTICTALVLDESGGELEVSLRVHQCLLAVVSAVVPGPPVAIQPITFLAAVPQLFGLSDRHTSNQRDRKLSFLRVHTHTQAALILKARDHDVGDRTVDGEWIVCAEPHEADQGRLRTTRACTKVEV